MGRNFNCTNLTTAVAIAAALVFTAGRADAQLFGPNLVVREIEAPEVAAPGALTLGVVVCNIGNAPATNTQMAVLASPDPVVDPSDPSTGWGWIGWLEPSRCDTFPVDAGALPMGTSWLGVLADPTDLVPEQDEGDNLLAGAPITVGWGADLRVTRVEVPSSADGYFTAQVTVCNQGFSGATATDVWLHASVDDVIEPLMLFPASPDTDLGTGSVPSLGPNACATVELSAGAPQLPAGAYYVGAWVDEVMVVPELLENNNLRTFGRMGLGLGPDLVLTAVDAPPSAAGPFEVGLRACNHGTAAAGPVDVALYLSADQALDAADQPIGTAALPTLVAGQCTRQTISAILPAVPVGPYFIAAVADEADLVPELREDNGTAFSAAMGVGAGPDLVVRTIDLRPGTYSEILATVTVCNDGTATSGATDLQLLYSYDAFIASPQATPSSPDVIAATAPLQQIDPGRCQRQTLSLPAQPTYQRAFVGAVADPGQQVPELREDNNVALDGPVSLGYDVADVAVTDVAVRFVDPVQAALVVTLCKYGDSPAAFDLSVVASRTPDIGSPWLNGTGPGEVLVASVNTWDFGLTPGGCGDILFPEPWVPEDGAWHLAAFVRGTSSPDLVERNNVLRVGPVALGYLPDLVVRQVSLPPSGDGPLTATVEVCNPRYYSTPPTDVTLYVSDDEVVEPPAVAPWTTDTFFGAAPVPALVHDECTTVQVAGFAAPLTPGPYFIGAVVDEADVVVEGVETNNLRVSGPIGLGAGPDLVVASVGGPASADGPFSTSVRICNQGTRAAGSTLVNLYLADDEEVAIWSRIPDQPLGAGPVPPLQVGQCAELTIDVAAPAAPPGAYVVSAVVDEANAVPELREDDNTTFSDPMAVGVGPDLTVRAVALPPSAFDTFDAVVTVCNDGTQPAPSTTFDLTVFVVETQNWYGNRSLYERAVGQGVAPALDASRCVAVPVNAGSVYGLTGPASLRVTLDPAQAVPELREDNNIFVAGPIGTGLGPDLVVTRLELVRHPPEPFRFSATTCNQGTDWSAPSWLEVLASTRSGVAAQYLRYNTLTPPDTTMGWLDVPGLAPGQCADLEGDAYLPSDPAGAWYMAALLDRFNSVAELREENNFLEVGPVGIGDLPDLTVRQVSLPSSADGPFTVTVDVCNDSMIISAPANVVLYASQDETIESPALVLWSTDLFLGAAPVPSVPAATCVSVQVGGFTAPPVPGAYYVGAVVDEADAVLELLETNNVTVAGPMGLGLGLDLVVSAIQLPTSVDGLFEAYVRVCNQGTAFAAPAGLTLYVTEDQVIDVWSGSTDQPIGFDVTPGLQAGQCLTQLMTASYPAVGMGAYFVGAVVDEAAALPELREDNNTTFAGPIGVGPGFDLVVRDIAIPPSASGSFDTTVTVCNEGTVASPNVDVTLLLSVDADIVPPSASPWTTDVVTAAGPVPSIERGFCVAVTLTSAAAMAPGAYYVGAIVDEQGTAPELREDNNTAVAGPVGLGTGPDLVLTRLELRHPVYRPEQLAFTVCNQGTDLAGSTWVGFVGSQTPGLPDRYANGLRPDDWFLNSPTIPSLGAGQCIDLEVDAYVSGLQGPLYIAGVLDPSRQVLELREDNNGLEVGPVGIGALPDLVIEQVSLPTSTDGPFTATVQVCNEALIDSPPTELVLYASDDDLIEPPSLVPWSTDLFLGAAPVPALAFGRCQPVRIDGFVVPPVPGAYYIGALVDEAGVVVELLETNNVLVEGPVGLGFGPDLVVTSIQAPTSMDGPTELEVEVCNQGTVPVGPTSLSMYVSADKAIEIWYGSIDQLIALTTVPGLQAGQCQRVAVSAILPALPTGPYYLGAVVDEPDAVPELREDNNTTFAGPIGVGPGPDLVVRAVVPPASANGSLAATVTVCNEGTVAAPGAGVTLALSSDATFVSPLVVPWSADLVIASGAVPGLEPGRCSEVLLSGPVAAPKGAYFVIAVVDEAQQVPELREDNNARAVGPVGIGVGPDLAVTHLEYRRLAPAPDRLAVTVCNQGTALAPPRGMQFVGSPNPGIADPAYYNPAFPDLWVDYAATPDLAAGQCTTLEVYAYSEDPAGGWYFAVYLAPDRGLDLRVDNDHLEIGPVGVGNLPDLLVRQVRLPWSANGPITLAVEVCNDSSTPSAPTDISVYASADATVEPPSQVPWSTDLFVASAPVPTVNGGECQTVPVSGFVSPANPGPYHIGALVDEGDVVTELLETNNSKVAGPIGLGFGPDLVVAAYDVPTTVDGPMEVDVTVCNQGTQFAAPADVTLYVTADQEVDVWPGSTDATIGLGTTPGLQPGQCAFQLIPAGLPTLPAGRAYIGIVLDEAQAVPELREDNNTAFAGPIGVGPGPDMVVQALLLPPSTVDAFTATATVCNQGSTDAPATDITLMLSDDAVFESPLTTPWSTDAVVASAPVPPLTAGSCAHVSLAGAAHVSSGVVYAAATVDELQAVPELREDNNVALAGPMGVGLGPDLVPTAIEYLEDPMTGPSLVLTVCNEGTDVSQSVIVDFVASVDPGVAAPWLGWDPNNVYMGFAEVAPLAAGACETQTLLAYPPYDPGAWYIAAFVGWQSAQLRTDNDSLVIGPIGFGYGVDLQVAGVSGPTYAMSGAEITATARVCNGGAQGSTPTEVRIFASRDDRIDQNGIDPVVGVGFVDALAPFTCADVGVPTAGFGALPIGVYRLAAEVDPSGLVAELVESNNAALGGIVEVTPVFCGNGLVDPGEACDDGNAIDGDGCTIACLDEYCGDGIINDGGAELCDDGGNQPYDGCSSTCTPQGALLGEVMQLDADQPSTAWSTLTFTTALTQPVVVAHTLSFNGTDPAHLRVRNVTSTGFEWKLEEWAYEDGTHATETLPFLAMDAGTHVLEDGTRAEAAQVTAGTSWTTITFQTAFTTPPVLLTGVMSAVDGTPVVVRTRNLTATSFQVRIQEEEGQPSAHTPETVAYIALEPGTGTNQGVPFEAGRTTDSVTHKWYSVAFSAPFTLTPVFFGNVDTFDGGDTSGLRYDLLTQGNVRVKVEEEQSRDSEVNHTTERVSWMAWGAPGPIVAGP